jgi:hypothetical protein
MGPLIHIALTLSRLARRRWTRAQAAVALGALVLAAGIVTADRLGYWPDWMRAHGHQGSGLRR